MPAIMVSDRIFRTLSKYKQTEKEPLDAVLDRLMKKVVKDTWKSDDTYRKILLRSLVELDGQARSSAVVKIIESNFSHLIPEKDRVENTKTKKPKWHHKLSLERLVSVWEEIIFPKEVTGQGVWSLTPKGVDVALNVCQRCELEETKAQVS